MDLQQLCVLLQKCTSYKTDERNAAEQALVQVQHTPGHVVDLLRVVVEESLDVSLRQVAAITLKNLVKHEWESSEGKPSVLPEQDKATVRDNLVEAVIRSPPVVRAQVLELARSIIYADFPERWHGLMEQIYTNLNTQDFGRVHGALALLRVVVRKYEFKDDDDNSPMGTIVNTTFPLLLTIFQSLLAVESPTLQHAELLKLVCKVFWSSTYMAIPDLLAQQQEQFTGWMSALHTMIVKPVPTEGVPEDPDERKRWVWWKTKKWALHIAYRLFTRYGEPKLAKDGSSDKVFAAAWASTCCMQYLEAVMSLVGQLAQGQYLSPRVTNMTLQYLTHALASAKTYKLLKPHLQGLLTGVVFPLCCFTDEDAALWTEDPHEYIRKGYDILEDMYSPKTSAMNFIHELCKSRGKGNLEPFMAHLVSVLNAYAAVGPAAAPADLARRMDGALLAVGALQDVLTKKDPYKGQLQGMLQSYVLPLFSSSHGHLRAKAAWIAGTFAHIEFAEGRGAGPVFGALLERVIGCLHDPELPVRVDGVVALRCFIEPFEAEQLAGLVPLLPRLLEEFFKLFNEVESDDLVATLETLVETFSEHIPPYALGLAAQLAAAFWKANAVSEQADEEDDEMSALAAYGCLRALGTVLESVSGLGHLFPQLEEILFPIMDRMLSTDGQDFFEEVVQMVSYFTYFAPEISPRMWTLWPKLHACLDEWAIDYFETILVPLDNYISRSTHVFLHTKSPDYLASASQIVERALTDTNLAEDDIVAAAQLLGIILQNCRGAVDACVAPYCRLALERLKTAENAFFKDQLVCVVANALYYNPVLALGALQQLGALGPFFTTWFSMVFAARKSGKPKHFKRQFDKKVCILGLSSLLTLPDGALPPELASSWGALLQGLLQLCGSLKGQLEEEEAAAAGDEEEESGEEEEGGGGGELEDDEDDVADDAYLQQLARAAASRRNDAEDDYDDDDEWTEDEEVQTPIDPVDPFVFFADSVQASQAAQPARYAPLLDVGLQQRLQEMVAFAQHQRHKKSSEAAS